MNILDDEFRVANYINSEKSQQPYVGPIGNLDNIKIARQWSKESMRTIILPTDSLEELEDDWIKFNSMIKKHRRESDWKSLELFGFTNQERYESLRSSFFANSVDIKNEIEEDFDQVIQAEDIPVTESYIDAFTDDPYYDYDEINYSTIEVEKARNWAEESNRTIIIPTRTLAELESLWDSFRAMYRKHCKESDEMSIELFGVTNLRHYEYLRNQFLRKDINITDSDKYGSVVEYIVNPDMKRYFNELCRTSTSMQVVKSLLELSLPNNNIYEERIISNVINTTMDTIGDLSQIVPDTQVTYGDLPYFTPDDMIDMGVNSDIPSDNFYGVLADNNYINNNITVAEWFEMYKATYDGFYTEFGSLSMDWINKVRSLMFGLNKIKESGDEKAINARKQSILELGWNPDIEFTDKARTIARECTINKMMNENSVTKVIDLRGFSAPNNQNNVLNEEISINEQNKLYPVFIVLTEGATTFSTIIKGVTKSIYSHASIAFDSTLSKMYSFGVDDKNKDKISIRGGFIEEDVKNTPTGKRIGVYTFFVPKHVYEKIVGMVELFKQNVNKTSYGYKNLFTLLFNIPYNADWSLICSQFVDRCLKIADIDITKKDSSFVTPEDLNKTAKNEKRIYNVYQGLASKYNASKIKRLINSLSKKATPIKENSIYCRDERSYIAGIITNINNVSFLKEMQYHIDLVKNPSVRRILEEGLFDSLEIKAYCEAKEFPIQFDKEGNLLIKNLKRINYEAEYSKSHRLLKQYEKGNNTEGIKYELSKLWMMNCLLEQKIHSKDKKSISTEDDYKVRAKIINDFEYYMKVMMTHEPTFNFTEYYDNSPFSSATTKINAPTLAFVGKMITKFIKYIV